MDRNNRITKTAAILLSLCIMVAITYSAVVSSIYGMHEHEHYEEEYCIICLELHTAEHLAKQLMPAESQNILKVFFITFASVLCIRLMDYVFERNLITDKVRMDR